jgi:hypothetical protein
MRGWFAQWWHRRLCRNTERRLDQASRMLSELSRLSLSPRVMNVLEDLEQQVLQLRGAWREASSPIEEREVAQQIKKAVSEVNTFAI